MSFEYPKFISRNFAFIDEPLQKKIRECRLFFVGCGVGSYIAELAVRVGFENFTLIDDDIVDVSNLNRQAYFAGQAEKKKIDALDENLLSINPNLNIRKVGLRIENVRKIDDLFNSADVVINSIDINEEYFELIRRSWRHGVPTILPFNIGYGGLVVWIPQQLKDVDNFLNKVISSRSDFDFVRTLVTMGEFMPAEYLVNRLAKIEREIILKGYNPQTAIASFTVSSITIMLVIKYLLGESRLKEKKITYFDWMEGI